MKNTLNYLGVLLVGIIIGIVCSLIIRSKLTEPIQTIIKYDTIRITEPQAEKIIPVAVKKFTTVPTLLTIPDTIKVPYYVRDTLMIPIEQKYYAGESYKAWVSGYNPKLDSLLIYQQTKTVTIEKTRQYKAELSLNGDMRMYSYTAISAGLEAELKVKGYGFVLGTGALATPSGWKWYGMAGIRYNLFTKKW